MWVKVVEENGMERRNGVRRAREGFENLSH